MSMSGDTLGQEIETALANSFVGLSSAQISQITNTWKAVATAIVSHITTNAVVAMANHTHIAPSGGGETTGPTPTTGTLS